MMETTDVQFGDHWSFSFHVIQTLVTELVIIERKSATVLSLFDFTREFQRSKEAIYFAPH
jgi:hypothetical protein